MSWNREGPLAIGCSCACLGPGLMRGLPSAHEHKCDAPMSGGRAVALTGGHSLSSGRSIFKPKSMLRSVLVSCLTAAGSVKSSWYLGLSLHVHRDRRQRCSCHGTGRGLAHVARKSASRRASWRKSMPEPYRSWKYASPREVVVMVLCCGDDFVQLPGRTGLARAGDAASKVPVGAQVPA